MLKFKLYFTTMHIVYYTFIFYALTLMSTHIITYWRQDYISHNDVTSALDVKHATTNLNEITRRYMM